ncbi:MAG: hypothetical protein LW630_11985 [Saprospiraceae bacterium]|jgi:hypothetical protein|nr:hypothetical protein [Saprospiraceae bacterium]
MDKLDFLPEDWTSQLERSPDEHDLLMLIAERTQWMLDHDKDLLLSYLYRLDIAESAIDKALMPGNPDSAAVAIAKLILQRQKERMESKKKYKVDPIEDWD